MKNLQFDVISQKPDRERSVVVMTVRLTKKFFQQMCLAYGHLWYKEPRHQWRCWRCKKVRRGNIRGLKGGE